MNIITKLNIRQKIMLGLTILAALFLGWQVYNFVHSQTKAAASATSAANTSSANSTTSASAAAAPANAPAAANVATLPPPQAVEHLPPSVATNPYAEMEQRQYLDLVRQYQLTKMKRQILEEEANAANAQKTISDASKGQAYQSSSAFTGYAPALRAGYQLAYLDRQAGQWVATLNQSGQYIEVREGSTLDNGWQVTSITRSGVILSNGERQRKLGFEDSENADISQAGYAVSNQSSSANLPAPSKAVQVKNIAQALGMTPDNNGLTIKPQSAKTAAEVIQDVPAAPLATTAPAAAPSVAPSAAPVKPIQPPAQPQATVAAQPASKPAVQPVTTTTVPVQNTDMSKNIFTNINQPKSKEAASQSQKSNNNNNLKNTNINQNSVNVNANQKPKTTLNQKIMEKSPSLPASVKNIAGPVDQAPVNDAIIPAPTGSTTNNAATNNSGLPAPEVSAAAEANANPQTGKAVNVKDLQQASTGK